MASTEAERAQEGRRRRGRGGLHRDRCGISTHGDAGHRGEASARGMVGGSEAATRAAAGARGWAGLAKEGQPWP